MVWMIGALGLGACVGSFVNVLIYRLPRERSVVSPGSHCFCCGTPLGARDLVPVFSYLLSGGHCRYCGAALSGQYATVEALCAVLYGALAWRWGPSLTFAVYAVAAAAMVAACGTDLRLKIIPNSLNQAIGVAGFGGALLALWLPAQRLPSPALSLLGAAVGWAVFESVVRFGRWWFGQEAMGGGDVLLAAAVGALLGPTRAFAAFFLVSIVAGAVIGLLLMAVARVHRRQAIPFGPFLVAGALTVMLAPQVGDWVAAIYHLG